MRLATSLFDEISWPTSVTEDTELHLELIQRGVVVRYAERASVSSAMPTTTAAAVDQQLRWESGNAELAGTHLLRLLTRGAATGNVQLLAAAAELLAPSQSMLAAGSLGAGVVSALTGRRRTAGLAAATLTGQTIYVNGGSLMRPSAISNEGSSSSNSRKRGLVRTRRCPTSEDHTSLASCPPQLRDQPAPVSRTRLLNLPVMMQS